MCISDSSIQGSGQTIFIVSLNLPSFTIWDQVVETSISYSFWTKLSSENEFAEVYVCSQPSCHPTRLQSSFHSSKLQLSFHSSGRHFPVNPRRVPCALIPEFPSTFLISSLQDLRYPFSRFIPLHDNLASLDPLFSLLVPLDSTLASPWFSLRFPLPEIEGSLMDHDLL